MFISKNAANEKSTFYLSWTLQCGTKTQFILHQGQSCEILVVVLWLSNKNFFGIYCTVDDYVFLIVGIYLYVWTSNQFDYLKVGFFVFRARNFFLSFCHIYHMISLKRNQPIMYCITISSFGYMYYPDPSLRMDTDTSFFHE